MLPLALPPHQGFRPGGKRLQQGGGAHRTDNGPAREEVGSRTELNVRREAHHKAGAPYDDEWSGIILITVSIGRWGACTLSCPVLSVAFNDVPESSETPSNSVIP